MFTTRPELVGTHGMVASTHWLASSAGMAVWESGGNAFDAAVAAGLTLKVVEPHLNGPGGEVPIIFHSAERAQTLAIGDQGPAPAAASIAHFEELGLELHRRSHDPDGRLRTRDRTVRPQGPKLRTNPATTRARGAHGDRLARQQCFLPRSLWVEDLDRVGPDLGRSRRLCRGAGGLDERVLPGFLGRVGCYEPSWGSMLYQAQSYLTSAWWMAFFPGMAIYFAVLGFNLLGDGVREALDPRTYD